MVRAPQKITVANHQIYTTTIFSQVTENGDCRNRNSFINSVECECECGIQLAKNQIKRSIPSKKWFGLILAEFSIRLDFK